MTIVMTQLDVEAPESRIPNIGEFADSGGSHRYQQTDVVSTEGDLIVRWHP